MKTFDILAAVRVKGQDAVLFAGLQDRGEQYHYHPDGGQTYGRVSKSEIEIVKTYATGNEFDVWDAEKEFLLEFGPKPQPPCTRLGWLAPNGDWYPCAYVAHDDLASRLLIIHYGTSGGGWDLKHEGWVAVKGGGTIDVNSSLTSEDRVTTAQKHTLREIVELFELAESINPDIAWDPILLANPEGYSLQSWYTGPTQDMYAGTFAQSLRDCYELYCGDDYVTFSGFTPVHIVDPYDMKLPDAHPGD